MTPADIEQIQSLWLQGKSCKEISEQLWITDSAVKEQLEGTIRPQWREGLNSRLKEDLAKVARLEHIAWEQFVDGSTPCETRKTIEKALLEGGSEPKIVSRAVRKVTKTGTIASIHVIQWCLNYRARIHARFAPQVRYIDTGSELRVAGMTPCELDEKMLKRLVEKIEERRRYEGR